ncbi:MAG: DUF192 domain-containing protein [Candidatus Peregrinibacteria bacterium]|nr:DUF192 domain-containing protein [Candidatus Peregrinibacteria bacterium]
MKRYLIVIVFTLFIIFLIAMKETRLEEPGNILVIKTEAGDVKISVEVARTDEEMRLGLMGRTELEDGYGMLFTYDKTSHPVMWMKNMVISLDILFIGSDLLINHIAEGVPPCTEEESHKCARYSSQEGAAFVLELPEGFAGRNSIAVGNQVILPEL